MLRDPNPYLDPAKQLNMNWLSPNPKQPLLRKGSFDLPKKGLFGDNYVCSVVRRPQVFLNRRVLGPLGSLAAESIGRAAADVLAVPPCQTFSLWFRVESRYYVGSGA